MAEPVEFGRGAVLIDKYVLLMGLAPLHIENRISYDKFIVLQLAQVVEAMVLHESLVVMLRVNPNEPISPKETKETFEDSYKLLRINHLFSYVPDPIMEQSFGQVVDYLKKEGLEALKVVPTKHPKEHVDRLILSLAASSVLQYYYAGYRKPPFTGELTVFSDSELQRFLGIGDDKSLITSAKVMQEISAAARDRIGHINALLSTSRFSLDVPLVFNHILEKVRSRADIMPAVLEVRESREARAFRQQMAYLDEATEIGDDQVIFEIVQEMRDKVDSLRRKIDQPTVGFQVSFPLAVGLDPFGLWKLIKNRRKRHLTFIDQLYSSAAAARPIQLRLGRLRE